MSIPTLLDALDIADVDTFDPNARWRENDSGTNLRIPLGTGWDADNSAPSTAVKTIDPTEHGVGGDGQHGAIQGENGASVGLIATLALGLCATYGSDKVNLLFVESRSRSTLPRHLKSLPQTLPSVTGFKDNPLALDILYTALCEELDHRKDVLRSFKLKDMAEYHCVKDTLVDAPSLPHIVMFVLSENDAPRPVVRKLSRVFEMGAYGRSLGVHVIVVGEEHRFDVLGEFAEHISWGVSLKSSSAPASQFLVGDDSPLGLDPSAGVVHVAGARPSYFGMLDCGEDDATAKALTLRLSQFRREGKPSVLERILSRVDFRVEDEQGGESSYSL